MTNKRVWMNKKTGDLYEAVFGGCFGPFITWEDLTTPERKNTPITDKSPIRFSDEYEANDYEDLGEL